MAGSLDGGGVDEGSGWRSGGGSLGVRLRKKIEIDEPVRLQFCRNMGFGGRATW